MKTSQNGINLIKQFEGLQLKAYICAAGKLTIGYGHTGPDVKAGMKITDAEAEALLAKDLSSFEAGVSKLVKVPLTQNQFDALVAFTFNVGTAAFGKPSTMLKLLNLRDYDSAAKEFGRWVNGGGRPLPGLVKRRAAERALFEKVG